MESSSTTWVISLDCRYSELYNFSLLGFCLFLYNIRRKNLWTATWQNQENECASSEDSDQPGHPPSLIIDFAIRMKKPWVLSYPLSTQPSLIRVFAGRTLILLVLSCRGSYVCYCVLDRPYSLLWTWLCLHTPVQRVHLALLLSISILLILHFCKTC